MTQQRSPVAEYSVHDMGTKLGKKDDLEDTSTDTMCKIYTKVIVIPLNCI